MKWLGYIREHLIKNLTIGMEDFEYAPVFERHGGKSIANTVFNNELEFLIAEINFAIAA
jgi:type I restriction enzyme R subunit